MTRDLQGTDLCKIIGRNIRIFRLMRGKTQSDLGYAIDVTFQQIQKYESGHNSIKAEQLLIFSQLLEVPVESFYSMHGISVVSSSEEIDKTALKLSALYRQIPSKEVKAKLLEMVKVLIAVRNAESV